MLRLELFAVSLFFFFVIKIGATPVHNIQANLGFSATRLHGGIEYEFLGNTGARARLAASYKDKFIPLLQYDAADVNLSCFYGSGNPENSLALRDNPVLEKGPGNSIPWKLSTSGSGARALGIRLGGLDSFIVFDDSSRDASSLADAFGAVSALAFQFACLGKMLGGGAALGIVNLKKEEYGSGWGERNPVPSSGGLFTTLDFSGRVGEKDAYLECWASICAGALEAPGAALSISGNWLLKTKPSLSCRFSSFFASPKYRTWMGDVLEWDFAFMASVQCNWPEITTKLAGQAYSESESNGRLDWLPGKASLSLSVEALRLGFGCEAEFVPSGLDIASAELSRTFLISAGMSGKARLGLSVRGGDIEAGSAGFFLDWQFKPASESSGKASISLSLKPGEKKPIFSLSGSILQEIPILKAGKITLAAKSPEGGYALEAVKPELPDLSLSISLQFPSR